MLSTAESFMLFVSNSTTFASLRDQVDAGGLNGAAIRTFVASVLDGFQVGRAFHGDKILALIAQLVAYGPEPFAGQYLRELGALYCSELPLSPRIARRVLRQRA